MPLEVLRWASPAFIVVSALAFIALERRWPYERGLPVFRDGFWTDLLFYTFLQSFVAGWVVEWIGDGLRTWTGGGLQFVTAWPFWLQVAFFTVTHDLYIWWFHKLCHEHALLWRVHEAHHSPRQVDWLSGVRSHFVEIVINGVVEFTPMLLLGAAPGVPLAKAALSAVWGMFIHANLDVRLGPLRYVLNGPELHRWHHAEHEDVYYANYATKLSIWDWLFGTIYDPGPRKPALYGLPYRFPRGYFAQLAAMFRPLGQKDAKLGRAIGGA